MPKRTDIKKILLIGSGPIVIGQACEFDYSGTQAVKALKEEGYQVVLVNSNPATIMTDPEFADRTYVEPITATHVAAIIEKERPDALLPTMGGQTALNVAIELAERGVLDEFECELIGAKIDSITMAEDRELFRQAMDDIGLQSARSGVAHSLSDAEAIAQDIGYPIILRPSRTLGGSGGGIVEDKSQLHQMVAHALQASPNSEVLLEQSLLGWKEFELEVMRDLNDNVVIICSIENIDPMGVHTGDSITVAPIQTLTDKEYQVLRDAAIKIIRKIGVDTGGSNVQFAVEPHTGRVIVIEMNPRVSRSSALASKATGFPIAKIAAKLAVGYTLDELSNDITRETPACFEPALDYTVLKIPRFAFEKFPLAESKLGTQMKSVGEAMAIGRNFAQALQKALCSLEQDSNGFDRHHLVRDFGKAELLHACRTPTPDRMWYLAEALRSGISVDELYAETSVDPWFLAEISSIVDLETRLTESSLTPEFLSELKSEGFSDQRIASLSKMTEEEVRKIRIENGITPKFRLVDTCAAEFVAHTPYLYSSYDTGEDEALPTDKKKVVILGSGPNRIGQGIEFDYCCVHALQALKEDGYETIMINCNPETVSTDYDTSDRLYFEPLMLESVLAILEREKPTGVIVQFGGQTPLKLAQQLHDAGIPILGTSVDSINMAEDRELFSSFITQCGFQQPDFATARSLEEALLAAEKIQYPLMIRPSFVLGGRAMRIVYSEQDLRTYMHESVEVSNERPVLLDRFLHNAIEVDLDAVCDGKEVAIAGVMEHIERAGIHSGDSSCCLPPQSLSSEVIDLMKAQAKEIALGLKVVGLMNIQFAVTPEGELYILEVNPRASRTVPFVSKATGVPWAKIASRVMAGRLLSDFASEIETSARYEKDKRYCAVKACVFPFRKFAGVDTILGPEMKSTGEVMGIDTTFAGSFARAQAGASIELPLTGRAFISVADRDKDEILPVVKSLIKNGFEVVATHGTASYLASKGVKVSEVKKVREGSPHVVDMLGEGEIQLVINTPEGHEPLLDSRSIRLVAHELSIPTYTTVAAAAAATEAIRILKAEKGNVEVCPLQTYHTEPVPLSDNEQLKMGAIL